MSSPAFLISFCGVRRKAAKFSAPGGRWFAQCVPVVGASARGEPVVPRPPVAVELTLTVRASAVRVWLNLMSVSLDGQRMVIAAAKVAFLGHLMHRPCSNW